LHEHANMFIHLVRCNHFWEASARNCDEKCTILFNKNPNFFALTSAVLFQLTNSFPKQQ